MIPETFIQELLNRIDIVDVIDKRITLKKAGANYSACCPFHQEKTPSFTVSPSKQFYHCFGCGEHGSAISFLIEYEGLTFIDAINELAKSIGLKVPNDTPQKIEKSNEFLYLEEVWCKNGGYKNKAYHCLNNGNILKLYFIEKQDFNTLTDYKKKVRQYYKKGKDSVHIPDTQKECNSLLDLLWDYLTPYLK